MFAMEEKNEIQKTIKKTRTIFDFINCIYVL